MIDTANNTDSNQTPLTPSKPQSNNKAPDRSGKSLWIFLAIAIGLAWFVFQDIERAKNICLMLLGFGAVIFVHELGHFVAAKAVNIEVEAFSLGINPILIGIKRIQGGFRVRVLPGLAPGKDGQGALSFTIPQAGATEGETEYRLCMIPFGGFVKMLGQEDIGTDQPSDNPRAFGNKPAWQRVIVISAGVFMNILSAGIVFMFVFWQGLNQAPAIAGAVQPDSAAAQAGIKGGDEILAIDGKEKITFMHLTIAAAFADNGETIPLKVRHPDGTIETYHVEPKIPKNNNRLGVKMFGIAPASTLTLQETIEDAEFLESMAKLGFQPGDTIVAVNGTEISRGDQFEDMTTPLPGVICPDTIALTVERSTEDGTSSRHEIHVPMVLRKKGTAPERRQGQILGMEPRLRVVHVAKSGSAENAGVQKDDVILRFGSLNNPTHKEMLDYCQAHEDKAIDLLVLRTEDSKRVETLLQVTPKSPPLSLWQRILGKKAVPLIGVGLSSDLAHPVVAHCKDISDTYKALPLPRGSIIQTIAGTDVQSWQDILKVLVPCQSKEIEITYLTPNQQLTQTLTTTVPDNTDWIGFVCRPDYGDIAFIPLEPLERIYKSENWRESIRMGADMTYSFIAQTYLFIRGMIKGTISYKAASGPVGILKMSYTVAQKRSIGYYCFFIAMISVAIAVFNFLPIPVLDGGLVVLLVIEKIKGSPLSLRTQTIINTTSWLLILGLFALVTWQDIVKVVTGVL